MLVGYLIIKILFRSLTNRSLLERQAIEIVWTALPALILLSVAFPSLRLLYLLDEVNNPELTLKVIGRQWYWRYEYSDLLDVSFDRYIIPTKELNFNGFRLLETDYRIVIPQKVNIRILVTAGDVIHSWTIPSLGVKADAVPGRLNQIRFICNRPGLYYGQCSEICGANHSFIPIVLERVFFNNFVKWFKSN